MQIPQMMHEQYLEAKQMIEEAFLVRTEDIKDEHSCILRNVVSRKKQVVPAIVGSLQH